jgi:asparagine synthase (glutamine-hydrolysing)
MRMLGPHALKRAGLFDAAKVERLVTKMQNTEAAGEIDSMALAGVLSSQIIHQQFVEGFPQRTAPAVRLDLLVDHRTQVRSRVSA